MNQVRSAAGLFAFVNNVPQQTVRTMNRNFRTFILLSVILIMGASGWILTPPFAKSSVNPDLAADTDNGLMLLQTAGCLACHTQEADYAGGLTLESPFGDFYSPNITLDSAHGIGTWTLEEFATAVRLGIAPDGDYYYPVMPFTSYQGMTDQDIVDMWAALQLIEHNDRQNQPHDMTFPFNQRPLLKGWRLLFFNSQQVDAQSRGAYLAEHVLHCGECHTPRNLLGGLVQSRRYQGNDVLPDDNVAPDIRPQALKLEGWTASDLELLLAIGMLPDGDFAGGSMTEVVDFGSSKLSDTDRKLLANYLLNGQ